MIKNNGKAIKRALIYLLMTVLGIAVGISDYPPLQIIGQTVADIFIKIFKCVSLPILALSLIVTLSSHVSSKMNELLRRTACYTFGTTIIAASIAGVLYLIIKPSNVILPDIDVSNKAATESVNYWQHLISLVPDNFVTPFIENQVISILLISILIGSAIQFIPDLEARDTVIKFFRGIHSLFLIIIKWIIAILPLGLFGFISITVMQFKHSMTLTGIGQYILIIILANVIQGFLILPAWLKLKGISPFKTMRLMLPALSIAFFSKSSAGTLPITIAIAEKNLQIDPKISRFILPLCTSINMNGCAAFIFTTVIFLMQNAGIEISLGTMGLWVIIATIAAIGNAGVPMGCYFLSASLLSGMDVPIGLMGIILPFYSVIDMLETSLNVWSDVCVTCVVESQITEQNSLPYFTKESMLVKKSSP